MKTALKIGALVASLLCAAASTAIAAPVKNILLVHGAFVDGSGGGRLRHPRSGRLQRFGGPAPVTGLDDDVAATKRILDQQTGPASSSVTAMAEP